MLKQLILRRHKTVIQFAKEVGMTPQGLYLIIAGKRRGRPLTRQKIADALELPVEFLFSSNGNKPQCPQAY